MVHQLNHRIKIIGCPTLREPDGLAMSSRNQLLTPEQRNAAPLIYKALERSLLWIKEGSIEEVKNKVIELVNASQFLKVQYFEIVDSTTLENISMFNQTQPARGCIAVLTDGPRLIDNIAYS